MKFTILQDRPLSLEFPGQEPEFKLKSYKLWISVFLSDQVMQVQFYYNSNQNKQHEYYVTYIQNYAITETGKYRLASNIIPRI